jgi:hypothetical protein
MVYEERGESMKPFSWQVDYESKTSPKTSALEIWIWGPLA